MELIKNACAFCAKNTTVISSKDSESYFQTISKENYDCNNLSKDEFQKLFTSKCLCLTCAYKIDHVNTLIDHIVSNVDSYFSKGYVSKKKCNWCRTSADSLFTYDRSTKPLQNTMARFVKSVTKKNIPFESWQICLKCYFCMQSWKDLHTSISNLNNSEALVNGNRDSSSNDEDIPVTRIKRLSRGSENGEIPSKKSKTDPKNTSRSVTPEVKSRMPKIKIKLPPLRKVKKQMSAMKKKRKSEEVIMDTKLKHLRTVNYETLSRDMHLSFTVVMDKRMMFDIPYIDLSKKEKKVEDVDSDSEVEYVEPSTSKGPTKPPVIVKKNTLTSPKTRKKGTKNKNTPRNLVRKETIDTEPDKEDSETTGSNKSYSESDEGSEFQHLAERATRNSDKRKPDSKEPEVKRNKRSDQKKGKINFTAKPKSKQIDIYTCSICKKDFESRCEHKLHELQHNIPFSPVVLLDSSSVDNHDQYSSEEETEEATKEDTEESKSDDKADIKNKTENEEKPSEIGEDNSEEKIETSKMNKEESSEIIIDLVEDKNSTEKNETATKIVKQNIKTPRGKRRTIKKDEKIEDEAQSTKSNEETIEEDVVEIKNVKNLRSNRRLSKNDNASIEEEKQKSPKNRKRATRSKVEETEQIEDDSSIKLNDEETVENEEKTVNSPKRKKRATRNKLGDSEENEDDSKSVKLIDEETKTEKNEDVEKQLTVNTPKRKKRAIKNKLGDLEEIEEDVQLNDEETSKDKKEDAEEKQNTVKSPKNKRHATRNKIEESEEDADSQSTKLNEEEANQNKDEDVEENKKIRPGPKSKKMTTKNKIEETEEIEDDSHSTKSVDEETSHKNEESKEDSHSTKSNEDESEKNEESKEEEPEKKVNSEDEETEEKEEIDTEKADSKKDDDDSDAGAAPKHDEESEEQGEDKEEKDSSDEKPTEDKEVTEDSATEDEKTVEEIASQSEDTNEATFEETSKPDTTTDVEFASNESREATSSEEENKTEESGKNGDDITLHIEDSFEEGMKTLEIPTEDTCDSTTNGDEKNDEVVLINESHETISSEEEDNASKEFTIIEDGEEEMKMNGDISEDSVTESGRTAVKDKLLDLETNLEIGLEEIAESDGLGIEIEEMIVDSLEVIVDEGNISTESVEIIESSQTSDKVEVKKPNEENSDKYEIVESLLENLGA